MDVADLKQIAEWLQAAGLYSIEIERPGELIRLTVPSDKSAPTQGASSTRAATTVTAATATVVAIATTVGVFLDRHPLRATALVQIGTLVKQGDVVGLVKNGLVMAAAIAPRSGMVTHLLVTPGTVVDYGRALIKIVADERMGE